MTARPARQTTDVADTSGSALDLIGNTPLIRLRRLEEITPGVELYVKAEWQNPAGSVKDRPAWRMLREGLATGALRPGRTILDATSGNTGIAYAMIGTILGYPVRLCLPSNVTVERRRVLEAYGVDLVFTDPLEGSDGAIRRARELYAGNPERYFYPDQYNNPANWQAHYDTTGPEILRQTSGRITHFVAGLGTSGTLMGTGRRLREHAQETGGPVTLVAVQPDSPFHGLEGLKHMASAIVPGIYDPDFAELNVGISTEDATLALRRLARAEGLLGGSSSGAVLAAGLQLASTLDAGVIVMVFADNASKYLSEAYWAEPLDAADDQRAGRAPPGGPPRLVRLPLVSR